MRSRRRYSDAIERQIVDVLVLVRARTTPRGGSTEPASAPGDSGEEPGLWGAAGAGRVLCAVFARLRRSSAPGPERPDPFADFYGPSPRSTAWPGLRLGYCLCADTDLLDRMALAGQPWPVSNPAQAAGVACPAGDGLAAEKLAGACSRSERPWLQQRPGTALGCFVLPGGANYLLFRSPRPGAGARLLRAPGRA